MRTIALPGKLNMKAFPLALAALAIIAGAPASIAADIVTSEQAIRRTVLHRTDVPDSNCEVVLVLLEVAANTRTGKHTHAGTVTGYVLEGDYTMSIEGQMPHTFKPGEVIAVPNGAPHDEYSGSRPAKLIAVFTVEKGKPLTSPVPPAR